MLAKSENQTTDPLSSLGRRRVNPYAVLLAIGVIALCAPTMHFVVTETWTGETGAHAPIILTTGLWLLFDTWKHQKAAFHAPPQVYPWILLAFLTPLYLIASIAQIVELEGYLMYACLLAVLYSFAGSSGMRALWFPLLYIAFIFPPPETVVAAITLPLKLWISQSAVWVLAQFGYPIGGQGVTINIGQYQLLVAAACAGLNTILSLSAITLFYAFVRHKAEPRYVLLLAMLVVPIALFANFVRVLLLILLTFHLGDAAGQGFMHNFAGLFMFAFALGLTFAIDEYLYPHWQKHFGARLAKVNAND